MHRRRESLCEVFKDKTGSSEVICIRPTVQGGQPGMEEEEN